MSLKTTYILFAILALMLLLFGISIWIGPTSQSTTNYLFSKVHEEGRAVKPERLDKVDRVEVHVNRPTEESWVFERAPEGKSWRITEPREYRADSPKIEQLVREVLDASQEPTTDTVNDPSKLELSPPSRIITIKEGNTILATLNVGTTSPDKDNPLLYVSNADKPNEVEAVRKLSMESVLKPLNDFRDPYLLASRPSDIQAFHVQQDRSTVELKKAGDGWKYVIPPYGDAADEGANEMKPDKPPQNVRSALTDLTSLRVASDEDFVKDNVSDLSEYHLGPKDKVLRLEIQSEEASTSQSEEEKSDKKTARLTALVAVGQKVGKKKDQYHACREGEHEVIRIAAQHVDPFLKLLESPEALRDRDLVSAQGSLNRPDAIDIQNSYGNLELRRADEVTQAWHLYLGEKDTKGYDADKTGVDNLVNLLTRKNLIESFPDPKKRGELGLEKPDVVLSLWVDGLAKADKKGERPRLKEADKPNVVLRFGNKQGSSVAVERRRKNDKEGLVAMVPAEVLDQVRRGPLEYVSHQLPSFAPDSLSPGKEVTRLVLEREGQTYELEHDAKKEQWKFTKPAFLAGRLAEASTVDDLLRTLNSMRASEVVSDRLPEPARLESEYGLKSPRYKATLTVTKDGKDQRYEYDFGKSVESKKAVYGRTSQSELIFTVESSVVEALQRELQDPTIFSFDPARVQNVKLIGWQDLQRKLGRDEALTLEAQRKGDTWKVITPDKLPLDAGKLDRLLTDLAHLRADRFVAHQAKPTADQELELSQGALKIVLAIRGEKQPLELTVGKLDKEKGYYAISNRMAGDIVEVPRAPFEGPRSEPAYFRAK